MIITSRSWVLLPILNHCLFVVVCLMQLTWVTGNHVQDLLTVPSCKIYINSKRHNWCFLSFYNMKIFWSMSHVGWQPAFIAHYKTLNWFSPFIIKTPFVTSKFRYAQMYKTRNHWDILHIHSYTFIFCIFHGVSLIFCFIHIYSHFNYMYLFERLSAWLNFILFDIHVFCPTFLLRVLNTHCNFCVNAKSKISFKKRHDS